MTNIRDLQRAIDVGDIALVVYSPDAFASHLQVALDNFIHRHTSARVIARAWVAHDVASIETFYASSVSANVPNWHLIASLFTSGPSLATLWAMPEAATILPRIKGRSHPARAASGTIRSLFWCDNPVCNLVHMSDSPSDVHREIDVVQKAGGRFEDVNDWAPSEQVQSIRRPLHNSFFILAEWLTRVLEAKGVTVQLPAVPGDGDVTRTRQHLLSWFTQFESVLPSQLWRDITDYSTGRMAPFDVAMRFSNTLPLTSWETLVLRCGAASATSWSEHALK